MKKNKILLGLVFMGLMSCGGETEENDTQDEEVVPQIEESQRDTAAIVEEFVPENEDGLWQIDDYAEMMKGCKIYNSWDDVPTEKQGSGEIYQTLDLKGGFASVTGAYEGWSEYVLWRMNDGNDLLGVMSAGCGPVCSYSFKFLIMKDGVTVNEDASADVLPLDKVNAHKEKLHKKALEEFPDLDYAEDCTILYNLPQKGTSMKVDLVLGADEIVIQFLDLSWDKTSFSISKYYEEVEISE